MKDKIEQVSIRYVSLQGAAQQKMKFYPSASWGLVPRRSLEPRPLESLNPFLM